MISELDPIVGPKPSDNDLKTEAAMALNSLLIIKQFSQTHQVIVVSPLIDDAIEHLKKGLEQ